MHLPNLLISAPSSTSKLYLDVRQDQAVDAVTSFSFSPFSCTIDRPNPLPSARFSSLPSIDCLGEIPRFQKVGIDGFTLRPPQIKSRKRRREESPLPDIFEGMEYGVDAELGEYEDLGGE